MSFGVIYWISLVGLMLFAIDDLKDFSWSIAGIRKAIVKTSWKEFENYGRLIAIFVAITLAPVTMVALVVAHLVETLVRHNNETRNKAISKWKSDACKLAGKSIYNLTEDKAAYYEAMRLTAKNIPHEMLKRIAQQDPESKWTEKDLVHAAIDEMLERAIIGK